MTNQPWELTPEDNKFFGIMTEPLVTLMKNHERAAQLKLLDWLKGYCIDPKHGKTDVRRRLDCSYCMAEVRAALESKAGG